MSKIAPWIPQADEAVTPQVAPAERGTWWRFTKLLWQARLPVVLIIALFVVSKFAVDIGLDQTAYTADIIAGDVSVTAVGLLVYAMLMGWLLGSVSGLLGGLIEQIINRNLRRLVWRKILGLPMPFFHRSAPRELVSRVTTDTNQVGEFLIRTIYPLLVSLYTTYAVAVRVFEFDPRLTVAVLVFVPLFVLMSWILGKFDFFASRAVTARTALLTQRLAELVANIPLIKTFVVEDRERKSGKRMIQSLYRARVRIGLVNVFSLASYGLVGLTQTLLIISTGIALIVQGDLTTPQWVAFFLYSGTLAGVTTSLTGTWQEIKGMQGTTSRIAEIVDYGSEPADGDDVPDGQSDIEYRGVSFAYDADGREAEVLHTLDVMIPKEQVTVIIGPSGSGKSTFLALLQRLFSPSAGEIRYHGRSIDTYDLGQYRHAVASVVHGSGLVSGTVRENLLLGIDKHVDDNEMIQKLNLGGSKDFVTNMPLGLNTEVGDYGSKLSGGQRNRIAIARALLRDSEIIALDEPTAALDSSASFELLSGLRSEAHGKTVVMIAHTPLAVRIADTVIVIEDGRVTYSGSPDHASDNEFYRIFMAADGKDDA